jgi:hypothetical protein
VNENEGFGGNIGVALGGILPVFLAGVLVPWREDIANTNVALALVVTVVFAAAIGGRWAGLVAAVVSTLSYDFFHTLPYQSLTIASQDDLETTVLLLIVGLAVGTLASRERRARASALTGREEIRRIHRLGEQVAAGVDGHEVIASAVRELTEMLRLQSCRYEPWPYSEALPKLERSGALDSTVTMRYTRGGFELPREGVEIPVLARGQHVGRFVLVPTPGVGASLESRVVAVALADQVGAALAAEATL